MNTQATIVACPVLSAPAGDIDDLIFAEVDSLVSQR